MSPRPVVVLIGPPAAGKSRIGKKVAKYLQSEFIDTDSVIVAENGPIADIFSSVGEEAFREIERLVVERALGRGAVVSLGGGAVMNDDTQQLLRGHRVGLLTVSPDAVARRIVGQRRPLLAAGSAEERVAEWQRLVDSRSAVYESLASRKWDTSVRPITAIAREIADWAAPGAAGTDGAGTDGIEATTR
jgi:shikimate kinase